MFFDVFQWVGGVVVLGQVVIGVVGYVFFVENYVFQYGVEFDGFLDDWFVFFGQVDVFGIVIVFDVEYYVFVLVVFVVIDQVMVFIGGQGGFVGVGQVEEQGYIVCFVDVGSVVYWQYVVFGQQEVLYGEYGFFYFVGIVYVCDQYFFLGEIEDYVIVGVGVVVFGYVFEVGDIEDLLFVFVGWVVLFWFDEQVMVEQILLGGSGGYFYWQVVSFGGIYMNMGNEMVLGVVECFYVGLQCIEFVGWEWMVDVVLGDCVFGVWFFDDEMVDW